MKQYETWIFQIFFLYFVRFEKKKERERPEKQYRNLENWFRPLEVIFHKNSIIEIKEINQQTLKTRDNVSRIFHWDIYYRYLYRKKYTYIYIVPIRFRTVFSKYFLTLISHDFHPWGCLKFIPLEREKKDRVNKFKANLINPPPGIIPWYHLVYTSTTRLRISHRAWNHP